MDGNTNKKNKKSEDMKQKKEIRKNEEMGKEMEKICEVRRENVKTHPINNK